MAKETESQQHQQPQPLQSTQQSSEDKLASKLLDEFAKAVLVKSENLDDLETSNGHGTDPSDTIGKISLTKVHGIDLNTFHDPKFTQGDTAQAILSSYFTVGYQGTHLAKANDIITRMLHWKPTKEQIQEDESYEGAKCKIFLGYTSNLVSSGLREYIRYLVQHSLVDVVVSTAGGVEEDLIKCLAPTLVADFALNGTDLRKRGLNRIGNLLVPNDNYCKFEEWVTPILDAMLEEQTKNGVNWTPSKVIHRLGKEINDESSICYWAYKNQIPIYCPAITDGSLGDMLFFHSIKHPGLRIDLMEDIQGINKSAMFAKCTGCIILGAGVVKHHICNANLMRNGADFAVYVNTSNEFDGSDAGASCDEAVSWGKLKSCSTTTDMIKVTADATLVFPLMVSQTFFPFQRSRLNHPDASSSQ